MLLHDALLFWVLVIVFVLVSRWIIFIFYFCHFLQAIFQWCSQLSHHYIYKCTHLDDIWYCYIMWYIMIQWYIYIYGDGSIPINTIFNGMNIHLLAILMFTRGTRFWHTAIYLDDDWRCLALWQSDDQNCWKLRWWAACTSWAWTSATAMVRTRLAWVSHGTKALNPPRHWSGSMGFKWFPTAGANSLLPAAESSSPYTGLQDRVEQATPARQKKSASCRTLGE